MFASFSSPFVSLSLLPLDPLMPLVCSFDDEQQSVPPAPGNRPEPKHESLLDTTVIDSADVLCGRTKASLNHGATLNAQPVTSTSSAGNRNFRTLVVSYLPEYIRANSTYEKSRVIHFLVCDVRNAGGRFLKLNYPGRTWAPLTDRQARQKVGHALRDAAAVQRQRQKRLLARNIGMASPCIDYTSMEPQHSEFNIDFCRTNWLQYAENPWSSAFLPATEEPGTFHLPPFVSTIGPPSSTFHFPLDLPLESTPPRQSASVAVDVDVRQQSRPEDALIG